MSLNLIVLCQNCFSRTAQGQTSVAKTNVSNGCFVHDHSFHDQELKRTTYSKDSSLVGFFWQATRVAAGSGFEPPSLSRLLKVLGLWMLKKFYFLAQKKVSSMDGLGWYGSEVVANSLPVWNSQRNDIEDSFLMSNSNSSMYGGKMDLPEDIFNPIQELQKAQPSRVNPDLDIVREMALQPVSELDSVNVASNFNMLQRQSVRLAAETSLLKSANWGDALTQELCSSPLISRAYGLSTSNWGDALKQELCSSPLISRASDIDMAVQSQVIKCLRNGKAGATSTGSLESLDCLLTATNSNTDTSAEDDGISMIFSDCKKLWNFTASSVVSSGESENNGSNTGSKDFTCHVNELDETVSQSSSDPYINNGNQSQAKSSSPKRGNDQSEFEVGLNRGYFKLLQTDPFATEDGNFRLIPENPPKAKKARSEERPCSSNINFQQPSSSVSSSIEEPDPEAIAQMKEMIYRAAAFRPVNLGLEVVEKPKRKNVHL
ncbi:hypothetical protein CRYUN_Cryun31cG0079200 [Craigia yunnanensis]